MTIIFTIDPSLIIKGSSWLNYLTYMIVFYSISEFSLWNSMQINDIETFVGKRKVTFEIQMSMCLIRASFLPCFVVFLPIKLLGIDDCGNTMFMHSVENQRKFILCLFFFFLWGTSSSQFRSNDVHDPIELKQVNPYRKYSNAKRRYSTYYVWDELLSIEFLKVVKVERTT